MTLLNNFAGKDTRNYWMGISIVGVVLLHLNQIYKNDYLALISSHGDLGVDVFLYLSAFGLCYSFTNNTLFQFYRHRFLRLFPLYPIFMALLVYCFGYRYDDNLIMLWIYNVTGIAMFSHTSIEWYVPTLICLYLLFPIIFRFCKWIYENHFRCAIAMIATMGFIANYGFYLLNWYVPSRILIIYIAILSYFAIKKHETNRILLISLFPVVCALVGGVRQAIL